MISVNVVSESALTVGGHGVHSVFLEDLAVLREHPEVWAFSNRLRRADIVHVHTVGPFSMGLMRAGRRGVITAHLTQGSLAGSLRGNQYWHSTFLQHLRACYRRADAVIAVSPFDLERLAAMGVKRSVHLVPNAVDVAVIGRATAHRVQARTRLDVDEADFVVVGVGQVQPRKRIDNFVVCARQMPEVSFVWVGGLVFGPLTANAKEMKHMIRAAPSNVRFTGPLDRVDVFTWLAAADVFFLPSQHENCPMAALEGAAAGLPVVLRDLPEYREQFGAGCNYGTDETFVDIIGRLRSDPLLRAQYSAQARAMVAAFDTRTKAARLLEVYKAVIG